MRGFWGLPALLALVKASPQHWSVYDDLQAYPQYEIVFSRHAISEESAESLVSQLSSSTSASDHIEPYPTPVPSILGTQGEQKPFGEDASEAIDDVIGYEAMILKGEKYLCSIPRVIEEPPAPPSNKTKEEEERELAAATERGWQLLKGMEGSCIYFISGWWSYSFCFNEGVKQFHQLPPGRNVPAYPPVEDPAVGSYVLGRFDTKVDKTSGRNKHQHVEDDDDDEETQRPVPEKGLALPKMQARGENRYLVQTLQGGTECDLTGKPRRVEVQFHCEATSSDRISMIKETATCQYIMMIATPRLCNDVAFVPPQEKAPHTISCSRVLPADQVATYEVQKDETKDSEIEDSLQKLITKVFKGVAIGEQILLTDEEMNEAAAAAAAGLSNRKLVIGGIEVGGHAVVPRGKLVESSGIVGGGKETTIATIARSDGWIMPNEELAKLNMRADARSIAVVKKQIEDYANGKGWRLDVVETARGKELRGIIDENDNQDDGDTTQAALPTEESRNQAHVADLNGAHEEQQQPQSEDVPEQEEEGSEETYHEEL